MRSGKRGARALWSDDLSVDVVIFRHQLALQVGTVLASSSRAEISQLLPLDRDWWFFALSKRAQIGPLLSRCPSLNQASVFAARGGSCRVSFCSCLLREKDGLICQEKVAVLFRLNLRDALRSLGKYTRPLPLYFKIVLHCCVILLLATPGFEFQLHRLVTFLWDRQIFLFHPPHFLLRIR